MYSKQQKEAALKLYKHSKSVSDTVRILGYPTRKQLYNWIYEEKNPPKVRKKLTDVGNPPYHPRNPSLDVKLNAIHRCFELGENIKYVSENIGYSRASIYQWRKRYMKEGTIGLMNNKNIPSGKLTEGGASKNEIHSPIEEIDALKSQMKDMQMEIDILKETINVLKKDPGIDQTALSNREKAAIIDAMKNNYSLPSLLYKLQISKSSYYYQKKAISRKSKYENLKTRIKVIYEENNKRYGYRRIHASLKRENIVISEKIIRRIMSVEGLTVKIKKTAKYNSYAGEITPAVPNKLNGDFTATKPNAKWLTDITEFAIPAGKVYLSPIVDCFDGLLVAWNISISPDAKLVNKMLDDAISKLQPNDKPIVHSDRGVHYRWPGWIERMPNAGLTRSMSKKGCSPDNSACEGVFGRLKNEMFYNTDWRGVSLPKFIDILNNYLIWYNETRIKKSLGYISPMEYRQSLGLAA